MAVLAALDEVEDQIFDVEGSTPYLTAVVPSQRLLVLGRAEEGNVARFIQLVHGILEGCLGPLFIVRPWQEGGVEDVSAEGLRPQQARARASVLVAVIASATTRVIAMASSLSWVIVGTSMGIEGVVCITVAPETLMHRNRGAWPTALRRLVD